MLGRYGGGGRKAPGSSGTREQVLLFLHVPSTLSAPLSCRAYSTAPSATRAPNDDLAITAVYRLVMTFMCLCSMADQAVGRPCSPRPA